MDPRVHIARGYFEGDEDCIFGGVPNKCNRISNRCIGSSEAEDATLTCIIKEFSLYEEFFLKVSYFEHLDATFALT